jgi:hypothetical protein
LRGSHVRMNELPLRGVGYSFRLAVLRLLGIYDADDPHIDQAAKMSSASIGTIMSSGSLSISTGGGNESNIEREHHSLRY